jgi:D-3-phosphoglycerate dehydrogenase
MPPKADLLVIPDDHPPVLFGTHLEPRIHALAREVGWHVERPADETQLLQWISQADVVVNLRASVYFPRQVLEQCPNLRLISIWAVGTDNVDLEACRDIGITVCNTPGYAAIGVAEHAIALALAVTHQLAVGDRRIRSGGWQDARIAQLHGKTLGILGVGPIGQRMVELGRALGMKAVAWTLHPSPERATALGVELVPLQELLQVSDVVSIHLPITAESHHLLGATELAMVKPTAIIVNTGRGAVIDEPAMVQALQEGRLSGAGLDVFTAEPLPQDSPLCGLENVVLSPHVGAMSPETSLAGLAMAIDNIEAFLAGTPANIVVGGTR